MSFPNLMHICGLDRDSSVKKGTGQGQAFCVCRYRCRCCCICGEYAMVISPSSPPKVRQSVIGGLGFDDNTAHEAPALSARAAIHHLEHAFPSLNSRCACAIKSRIPQASGDWCTSRIRKCVPQPAANDCQQSAWTPTTSASSPPRENRATPKSTHARL
jgi:hypothetical protein